MNLWYPVLVTEQGHCFLTLGAARIPVDKRKLPSDSEQVGIPAGIRPEHIKPAAPEDPGAIRMEIHIVENTGREVAVFLTAPEMASLTMVTGTDFPGRPGQPIYVRLLSE